MLELAKRCFLAAIILGGTLIGPGAAVAAETLSSPSDWEGLWRGRYLCAQGPTGLTLTIKPSDARNVIATFSFYALAENPDVPRGEFKMAGRLDRPGHLTLLARRWVHRPLFYVSVNLDGDYDPVSGRYEGKVDGPGCTSFVLRRDLVS